VSQLVTGPGNAASGPPRSPGPADERLDRRPDPGAEQRSALARLLVVVVAVVLAAIVTHTTSVLIVVVALVIMIMLHELGHLLTAKWGRMKVTEYFLGFGPRLWSIRRGETEYGIKAIPAGGYVKILGMTSVEEVDPADESRTYRQRPFHNRLIVAVAGSAMHGVMAFVLLWGLFVFIGAPQGNAVAIAGFSPLAHGVDPARAAGLKSGDVVVRIDGAPVHSASKLQSVIEHHTDTPVTLVVDRGGRDRTIVVTPKAASAGAKGHIGVLIGQPNVRSGPVESVGQAGKLFGRVVTGSFTGMGQVFSASGIKSYIHDLTNAHAASQAAKTGDRPQSIYGAARIAVQGAQAGATQLILVLVTIIVFVGIINLFPMLPLDGGHVVIAVYERIRSRRGRPYHADITKLAPVVWAFVLLLGFVVVTSLYLDITHPVNNPFQ
jgi:membrane-associated protease RseP (regulator of RpoE activity)